MKCRNTCTLPRVNICHLAIACKALHHLQVLTQGGPSSSLAGHFSKLFKLAGLSRLEIVPNHGVLQKKSLHLESVSDFPLFVPKSRRSLKKKVFTWNRSQP